MPRRRGLQRQALLLLVLLGLLPQVVVSFIEDTFIRRFTEKQVELSVSQALDHLMFSVTGILQSFINLAIHTATNHEIIATVQAPFGSEAARRTAWAHIRGEIFRSEKILNVNYPFHYLVVTRDGSVFTNFAFIAPDDRRFDLTALQAAAWYPRASQPAAYSPRFDIEAAPDYLSGDGAQTLYFVQTVVENWETVGVVAIGVNASAVSRLLDGLQSETSQGTDTSVFLVDDSLALVLAGEANEWGREALGPEGPFGAEVNAASVPHERIGQRRYFLFGRDLSFPGAGGRFRVLAATTGSAYHQSLSLVRLFYFVLLLSTCAIVVVLIIVIERRIVSPIVALNDRVRWVEEGSLESGPPDPRQDEIGELGRSFNRMVQALAEHIRSIRDSEAAKRNLEIRYLQAQLKPHFVRNTLNTIRFMAQIRGARGIESAVMSFSRILSYLLAASDELVSVREELEYIEQYVFLQKIRYQHKLSVELRVAQGALDLRVPKLIFQPVVENSILHGLAPKEGQGHLLIDGGAADGSLQLAVQDDGVGMEPEVLAGLRSTLREPPERFEGSGIGLANVQKRIRHYFGPDFGLSIDSRRGEGTRVVIRLPRVEGGRHEAPDR